MSLGASSYIGVGYRHWRSAALLLHARHRTVVDKLIFQTDAVDVIQSCTAWVSTKDLDLLVVRNLKPNIIIFHRNVMCKISNRKVDTEKFHALVCRRQNYMRTWY